MASPELNSPPDLAAGQAARTIALQMLEERGRGAVLVGVARVDAALEHLLQAVQRWPGPVRRGDRQAQLQLPAETIQQLHSTLRTLPRPPLLDSLTPGFRRHFQLPEKRQQGWQACEPQWTLAPERQPRDGAQVTSMD